MSLHDPVLLLDFDGVLHPDHVYRTPDGRIVLKREGLSLFAWAPQLESVLGDFPEVGIVLSTSWVSALGFEAARDALPGGLRERVSGSTMDALHAMPRSTAKWKALARWKRMQRADQILRYVEARGLARWVAVDDDVTTWPEAWEHRLVRCDPDLGLSDKATSDALRIALGKLHG